MLTEKDLSIAAKTIRREYQVRRNILEWYKRIIETPVWKPNELSQEDINDIYEYMLYFDYHKLLMWEEHNIRKIARARQRRNMK